MKWLDHFKILIAFAAHILTAIAVFCVVGAGAWVLHLVRHWLELQGLDTVILKGMEALEWLFYGCDFVATGFWAVMSTMKAIREIKEINDANHQ